jgi:hypothetical protein
MAYQLSFHGTVPNKPMNVNPGQKAPVGHPASG